MNVFFDPNFYIFLSFGTLLWIFFSKFKGRLSFYLQKQIDAVSSDLNQAACEKDEALLAYTRANATLAQLPDDVVKIWEDAQIDSAELEAQLAQDLEMEAALNTARLQQWKRQLIQKAYTQNLDRLGHQFREDVRNATDEQKSALIDQSLDLLGELTAREKKEPFL